MPSPLLSFTVTVRARPWRTALEIASRRILVRASSEPGVTAILSSRSSSRFAPSLPVTSSAVWARATCSGSCRGLLSAEIAPRDSSRARCTDSMIRAEDWPKLPSLAVLLRLRLEPVHLRGDEGQLLGDAVVQVAGDPAPLLEHGGLRVRRLVGADHPYRAHAPGENRGDAEDVSGVEEVGEVRGEEDVVQVGDAGDRGAEPEPELELVCFPLGAAGEGRRPPPGRGSWPRRRRPAAPSPGSAGAAPRCSRGDP